MFLQNFPWINFILEDQWLTAYAVVALVALTGSIDGSSWLTGASEPGHLHVWRKGAGPLVQGSRGYLRPNVAGDYSYGELAVIAGYDWGIKPKVMRS